MLNAIKQNVKIFNRDAFTVVGTPTITEDGIASGLSRRNYLTTNFISSFLLNKSWKIKQLYKVNSTTENGVLWSFYESSYSDISSCLNCEYNHMYLSLRSGDKNNNKSHHHVKYIDIPSQYFDRFVLIETEFNISNGKYTLTASCDNWSTSIDYTPDTENKQIYAITSLNKSIFIGGGVDNPYYDNCQINLSQFSIEADRVVVLNGTKEVEKLLGTQETTTVFNSDVFTTVGTPDVTANGIFTASNRNNFLATPTLAFNRNWKLIFNFDTTTMVMTPAVDSKYLIDRGSTSTSVFSIRLYYVAISSSANYQKLGLLLSTGNSTGFATGYSINKLQPNTNYLAKIEGVKVGTTWTYTLNLSSDNGNTWVEEISLESATQVRSSANLCFGVNPTGASSNAVFDLKQVEFYSNDVKTLSGAITTNKLYAVRTY